MQLGGKAHHVCEALGLSTAMENQNTGELSTCLDQLYQQGVTTEYLGLAEQDEFVFTDAIMSQSTQYRKRLSCQHKGRRGESE